MSSHSVITFTALLLIFQLTSSIHDENFHRTSKESREEHLQDTSELDQQSHHRNRQQHTTISPSTPKIQQQPTDIPYQYRPFAAAPNHIKQLIHQAYKPQEPYVNPHAFFYDMNPPIPYEDIFSRKSIESESAVSKAASSGSIPYQAQHESMSYQAPPSTQSTSTQSFTRFGKVRKQDIIKYENDVDDSHYNLRYDKNYYHQQQEQAKRSPDISAEKVMHSNDNQEPQYETIQMPMAIKQLLQYQAQIPYNVLANHIVFPLEKPFIPKPLTNDVIKNSGYPSQIFYVKTDGEVFDNADDAMGYKLG